MKGKRLCMLLLVIMPTVGMLLMSVVSKNDSKEDVVEVAVVNMADEVLPDIIEQEATPIKEPERDKIIIYTAKEVVYSEPQEVAICNKEPVADDYKFAPTREELHALEAEEELELFSSNKSKVEYVSPYGNVYVIDTWRLNELYTNIDAFEGLGLGDYNNTAAVIYDFLVFQMGVEHNIACGIVGNCAAEGTFGKKQSVKRYISSIEEARSRLDDKAADTGYGIAQWTTGGRRERLLKYYEAAIKVFDNFEDAQKVAELVNLYEEIMDYEVFDSYDEIVAVEDATGRISLFYEKYKYSAQDWTKNVNGFVSLTGSVGSGGKRLKYAYKVHEFYKQK